MGKYKKSKKIKCIMDKNEKKEEGEATLRDLHQQERRSNVSVKLLGACP
jgi:hypothetical protein